LDAKQNKMIAPYEKLKGAAFDRKYLHDMVAGHEAAISAYNKQSRDGQNPDIKAYATATLPDLQKHEDDAKALMKSSGKSAKM
jgi:putative membrane protein